MANIRAEIRRLKEIKEEWIAETYSKNQLKTVFKLTDREIKTIAPISRYKLSRYTKEKVSKHLDKKLPMHK